MKLTCIAAFVTTSAQSQVSEEPYEASQIRSQIFREETFGPAAAMVRARDAAHAAELANDTEEHASIACRTTWRHP